MTEEQVVEFVTDCQKQALEFIKSGRHAKRKTISKTNRGLIYLSIGERCPTCDLTLSEPTDRKSTKSYDPIDSSITIEHILPLDLGGDNRLDNMAPMCYACNVTARCGTQQYFVESLVKENRGKTLSEGDIELLNRFVEWSIRTVKSPDSKIDSEIQQYFETVREIIASKKSTPTPSKSNENMELKIAELEKRIQALENTLWKRIMRTIGKFFQRTKSPIRAVEKVPLEKQAPQPQKENLHNPDFTPEEFSRGLLRHKKRADAVTFSTLYSRLINEDSRYNLKDLRIKPNSYLLEYCSHLLEIEGREKGTKIHYWINEKEKTQAERDKKPSKTFPGTPRIEPSPIKSFKEIIIIILEQEKDPITFNSVGGKLSQYLEDEYDFTTKQFLILEGLNENLSIRQLIINQLGDDVIISDDNKEVELNRRG